MSAKLERSRPYRKRRRAEQEAETRLRITEATVDLHGSIGPARTTITAVAERAGVQRATVYRHFPDEAALFGACSSHWAAQHPLPDPGTWSAIADPGERLRAAAADLYAFYGGEAAMLENLSRDAPTIGALRPLFAQFEVYLDQIVTVLVRDRSERGAARRRARAAIGHALSFETWRSLVRDRGLSDHEAIELMCGAVEAAIRPPAGSRHRRRSR